MEQSFNAKSISVLQIYSNGRALLVILNNDNSTLSTKQFTITLFAADIISSVTVLSL